MIKYSDLSQALFEFWEDLGIPVYKTGFVPEDAPFPFMTFEVIQGDYGAAMPHFAFFWFQQKPGSNINLARALMADEIQQAIPADGVKIFTPSGMLWLQRGEKTFIQDYSSNEEIEGEPVIGLRVFYVVSAF